MDAALVLHGEALNADQAVVILESRAGIRIVFTDIDMPGAMDGMRLAAVIRDRWPPIEIILTSGHKALRLDDLPVRGLFFTEAISECRRGGCRKAILGFIACLRSPHLSTRTRCSLIRSK